MRTCKPAREGGRSALVVSANTTTRRWPQSNCTCSPDANVPTSPVNFPLEPRNNANARMDCNTNLRKKNRVMRLKIQHRRAAVLWPCNEDNEEWSISRDNSHIARRSFVLRSASLSTSGLERTLEKCEVIFGIF